jgi:hypothetical protein
MKKERKNCLCTAMLFVPENITKNGVAYTQPEIKYNNEQESRLSV